MKPRYYIKYLIGEQRCQKSSSFEKSRTVSLDIPLASLKSIYIFLNHSENLCVSVMLSGNIIMKTTAIVIHCHFGNKRKC